MKADQVNYYRKAAEEGTIPDSENPVFLFSITDSKLLVMGLNREFSFSELARMELANRGLNLKGEWVGFDKHKAVKKPERKRGRHL